jgi:hypothetical protein
MGRSSDARPTRGRPDRRRLLAHQLPRPLRTRPNDATRRHLRRARPPHRPAGTYGWPADLNDLGALRLRAYTATNWFDVLEVVDWHTKTGPAGRGVDYTLVIDNRGQPITITTDAIAFLGDA